MALNITQTQDQTLAGTHARGVEVIVAGKLLRLETSPGGAELLDLGPVPEGKKWTVHVNIDIVETNI